MSVPNLMEKISKIMKKEYDAIPSYDDIASYEDNNVQQLAGGAAKQMRQFNIPIQKKKKSTRTLVYIDLNETLIFRHKKHNGKSFVKRPYLDELISFIGENFDIVLWTSGTQKNMKSVIMKAFGRQKWMIKHIFYRNDCTRAPTKAKSWATAKNFEIIRKKFPSYSRMILIEDSDEKHLNVGENDIFIPVKKFDGLDTSDNELLNVKMKVENILKEELAEERAKDVAGEVAEERAE